MQRSTPAGRQATAFAVAAVALLAGGCDFQPFDPSELSYSLSENPVRNTVERLGTLDEEWGEGAGEAAQAQLLGTLEGLFGTPAAPRYAITEHLSDLEVDPNFGENELSDAQYDALMLENRSRRFELQLQELAAGRYASVPEPDHAQDLWARWRSEYLPALLENPDALYDEEEGITWKQAAVDLFTNHYPTLRESAELYRVQCLHCHGVEGGGNGPTSPFLSPRPRDYRQGVFKWVAVDRNKPPRREDLMNILRQGVTFTAMPSFARFTEGELQGLVDYVRLLAMRGQVEWLLALETLDSAGTLPPDAVVETYDGIWDSWLAAGDGYVYFDGDVPHPSEMTPERVARGKALFRGNVANCYTCHGVFGRGDGESVFELKAVEGVEQEVPVTFTTLEALPAYDHVVVLTEPDAPHAPLDLSLTIDGRAVARTLGSEELAALTAGEAVAIGPDHRVRLENGWKLHLLSASGEPIVRRGPKLEKVVRLDEWGNVSQPRNFQQAVFRGGGRPIDLYRRVKYGIGGTIMPAADASLSSDDLWNIVYYVYSITEKADVARIQERQAVASAGGH